MRSVSTRFVGLLLVALGAWGGLVPFVGHYFHFALGPDKSWDWTTARLYLDVLPAAATILGGVILMRAGPRRSARLGALFALAGGIWFAIGPEISQLWTVGGAQGAGHGSAHIQMLEMLTYHTGLGVVVAALAGYAFPRFPVVEDAAAREVPARGRVAGAGAAGAGAGALAGSRYDRRDDEPGALDAPRSERRAMRDPGFQREQGVTDEHVGREAAVGAGAAGAAAVAHHERRDDERGLEDEPGRGSLAGRDSLAARESEPGRESMAGRESLAGRESPDPEGAGTSGAGSSDYAEEPTSVRGTGGATAAPATASAATPGTGDATQETRAGDRAVSDGGVRADVHDAGEPDAVGPRDSADPEAVGVGTSRTGTTATAASPSHGPTVRRRRGGLLSGLLRR